MNTIDVYRDSKLITTLKPTSESALTRRIMGDNQVRIVYDASERTEYKLDDKITVFGEDYYLAAGIPTETKEARNYFKYDLLFKNSMSKLEAVQYLFLGADNSLKESEFSFTGKALDFVNLMIQNLKRLEPYFYFTVFEVKDTIYKTISFSGNNCLQALSMIAEAFELEYYVKNDIISLTTWREDTGIQLRQGAGKGIYTVTKRQVDETQLITRIYPFGGKENLPANYRNGSKRLKMSPLPRPIVSNVVMTRETVGGNVEFTITWTPPNVPGAIGVRVTSSRYNPMTRSYTQWGAPQNLPLEGGVYTMPQNLRAKFQFTTILSGGTLGETSGTTFYPKWGGILIQGSDLTPGDMNDADPRLPLPVTEVYYLERNIDKYGVHEASINIDDIFPHRTGTITAVDASNFYKFKDNSMNFDLNDEDILMPGATPKINFNSGQLMGYAFEIVDYDPVTKEFTIVKNKDEKNLDLPNAQLKPAVGDTYVITDIYLPQVYVDEAEEELKNTAQALLNQFCEPQLTLNIDIDSLYVKKQRVTFDIGHMVRIDDDQLEVSKKMRVVGIVRNILDENDYKLELQDTLTKSKFGQMQSATANLQSAVSIIRNGISNNALLNNRVIGPLVITSQGSIVFENLPVVPGATPIGIDGTGRIVRL